MTLHDCIQFTNENPICSFATIENNKPRVRILGFWFSDESGFYFQTSEVKEIPAQLRANPWAEACFYKHSGMIGTMLRISGKVEFLDDPFLKEKVIADRQFLKSFGLTPESPELTIFRISHGHAHFWIMENNNKPKDYIQF